jgi:hypothetical protein
MTGIRPAQRHGNHGDQRLIPKHTELRQVHPQRPGAHCEHELIDDRVDTLRDAIEPRVRPRIARGRCAPLMATCNADLGAS